MVFPNNGEDHAHCEFGNCIRGVGGDAGDGDGEFFGGREVDVVETSAAKSDVFLGVRVVREIGYGGGGR